MSKAQRNVATRVPPAMSGGIPGASLSSARPDPHPADEKGTPEHGTHRHETRAPTQRLPARTRNKGQVVTDDAYPDAHEPAEHGWLERRFTDDGEMSWWWTPQAETALTLAALTDTTGREN